MKTAKILTGILISAIGVLAIGAFATHGWRAERGLTLTALVAKSPAGLEGRLREFDAKLADANVKRESIRAQLAKYEVKEREIGAAAAQTLARLDSETRDAVKRDLRAGTASADVAGNPDAALAFEQFQEALVLRRESNALRGRLAQYELGMTRALAERDRLERRIELIDSLGYDPDTSDASSTAAENGLLDELAAMTDESTDERAARENRLRPTDVVSDADADRDALVDSVFAGSDAADTDAAPESERLSERLSQLAEERNARKSFLSRLLPHSPGKIAATLAVGFGVSVLAVLALGVVGLFVATGSSSSGVSQTVVRRASDWSSPVRSARSSGSLSGSAGATGALSFARSACSDSFCSGSPPRRSSFSRLCARSFSNCPARRSIRNRNAFGGPAKPSARFSFSGRAPPFNDIAL